MGSKSISIGKSQSHVCERLAAGPLIFPRYSHIWSYRYVSVWQSWCVHRSCRDNRNHNKNKDPAANCSKQWNESSASITIIGTTRMSFSSHLPQGVMTHANGCETKQEKGPHQIFIFTNGKKKFEKSDLNLIRIYTLDIRFHQYKLLLY